MEKALGTPWERLGHGNALGTPWERADVERVHYRTVFPHQVVGEKCTRRAGGGDRDQGAPTEDTVRPLMVYWRI